MEKKILQFRLRPEKTRRKSAKQSIQDRPTQLELITRQARNRYLGEIESIRRASIGDLSSVPYDAWGIAQKGSK